MASPSCNFNAPIPNTPTAASSCAVPIGSSNSTILDTCCNGHINEIKTYGAPGDDDDCYLYCTTDTVEEVNKCLEEKMGEFEKDRQQWMCFNAINSKASEGGAVQKRPRGKGMILLVSLGIVTFALGMC
jgi:hypothetical protein